jgi:hypothetical protein
MRNAADSKSSLIDVFFESQSFIEPENPGVVAVRAAIEFEAAPMLTGPVGVRRWASPRPTSTGRGLNRVATTVDH